MIDRSSSSVEPLRQRQRRLVLKITSLLALVVAAAGLRRRAGAATADALTPMPVPAQVPVTEAVAELSGTRLHYWDTGGNGPALVLLHPATGSALTWVYQQPAFAKAGYRVIGYSRRGYFGSAPASKDDPGIGAEDLHQLVAHLDIDKFHAVSSAAGGSIATDYALAHPERLLSLVVTSNAAGVRAGEIARLAASLLPDGFDRMPPEFRELGPSYRVANPGGVRQWLDLERKAHSSEPVRQRFGNVISAEQLNTIKIPTLLMTGDADLYTPPALLRMIAAQIPGSEVVIVPDTGHAIYWERPDVFNRVVLDFIGRQPR